MKMSKRFAPVIRKEMADHTFRPRRRELRGLAFGRSAANIHDTKGWPLCPRDYPKRALRR
jgi:hypothetical protein